MVCAYFAADGIHLLPFLHKDNAFIVLAVKCMDTAVFTNYIILCLPLFQA